MEIRTTGKVGFEPVDKNFMLIGSKTESPLYNKQGVLLLREGAMITPPIKHRLLNCWGKVFYLKKY